MIDLYRTEHGDTYTRGILTMPGGWACYTMEPPWRDNQTFVSCIPPGQYRLALRPSGVVTRTTGGEYEQGWEVTGVPSRTYIMIHIANTADQLEGCIAPGDSEAMIDGVPAVTNSADTFRRFMQRMEHYAGEDIWLRIE